MAQVSVSINGRKYLVACDDGQEDHLQALGAYLDEKVKELAAQTGASGDSRLLVMAALMIADELYETQRELETGGKAPEGSGLTAAREQTVAALESCARRIDDIAARLQEP